MLESGNILTLYDSSRSSSNRSVSNGKSSNNTSKIVEFYVEKYGMKCMLAPVLNPYCRVTMDKQQAMPSDKEDCNTTVLQNSGGSSIGYTISNNANDTTTTAITTDNTNDNNHTNTRCNSCLLYTSPSPRDGLLSRMPSSA